MKNLLILILLCPFLAFGQQSGYEVINSEDKELAKDYDKLFPGYYLTKDGQRTDCLILFERGDKLNFYDTPLTTAMAYEGKTEVIDKNNLQAFVVNNRLYIPAVIEAKPQWVRVKYQGAIQRYYAAIYMTASVRKKLNMSYDEEKQVNVVSLDTTAVHEAYWAEVDHVQKLANEPEIPILIDRKFVMRYVDDYAELYQKIKNKERGYKPSLLMQPGDTPYGDKMFARYNKWYDQQHPGKIIYYDSQATFVAPDQQTASAPAAGNLTEKEPHLAPQIDKFKDRPATASAAVASAKPEVRVKKESFKERLQRLQADGNKVGVLVEKANLVINPGSYAEGISKTHVIGTYGPLDGLDELAAVTAQRLNEGFGIDVFEAVDYAQIPVKEGPNGKLDDWWATKYKIIVMLSVNPSYQAYYKANESGNQEFKARMAVDTEMIVMAAEEAKPNRLRYVTSSPANWGQYRSEFYTGSFPTDIEVIQDLKAAINPPPDREVIKVLLQEQQPYLAKFVKKKSK